MWIRVQAAHLDAPLRIADISRCSTIASIKVIICIFEASARLGGRHDLKFILDILIQFKLPSVTACHHKIYKILVTHDVFEPDFGSLLTLIMSLTSGLILNSHQF